MKVTVSIEFDGPEKAESYVQHLSQFKAAGDAMPTDAERKAAKRAVAKESKSEPEKKETKRDAKKTGKKKGKKKGKTPTQAQVLSAGSRVIRDVDMKTVRGLLSEFGVKTSKDLKESDYTAFIARCDEVSPKDDE